MLKNYALMSKTCFYEYKFLNMHRAAKYFQKLTFAFMYFEALKCHFHSLCRGGLTCYFLFFLSFFFLRAATVAYGDSQARVQIRAAAAGLHHSHIRTRSEVCQQPIPELKATPDPQRTK